tara:strand:- start:62 stop:682 length:621 start_codon:yes stop_codon:yes gene_type:complete
MIYIDSKKKSHKVNFFSSAFFIFDDVLNCDKLDKMVDSVKNELPNESRKSPDVSAGPTYETNFFTKDSYTVDLTECVIALNERLRDERCMVGLKEQPWYAEYGPTDCHDPHLHCNFQYNINPENDPKKWSYSLIINLSNIGSTTFFNPNYAGMSSPFREFKSIRGGAIMFPSNILHWAPPHRVDGKIRRIISANLFLQYGEEWLCA